MANSKNALFWLVIVIIIGGGAIWWFMTKEEVTVYASDTTLSGDYTLVEGEKIELQNGATLTVDGHFFVDGGIECSKGPLNLVVKKGLKVNGYLYCDRGETMPDNDIGNGVSLVVTEGIEFTSDSALVTNGHVQLVDDTSNLATTQEKVDEIFADAADDSGAEKEGFRMGPFIPVESLDEITYTPTSSNKTGEQILLPEINQLSLLDQVRQVAIPDVHAQVPATDATGAPVADTVKIGGKWVVGDPSAPPPKDLEIPTPPKNIKKIILNFNFGKNNSITLANWTLTGPDGLIGATVTGSCDVEGGPGNDAMRLNVRAANIEINNFTLNLGNGGEGGVGETSKDCDPGNAKGGVGGKAGNFKMIASSNFDITGAFNVNPGAGGLGGKAIAHGKTGESGCPGTKGGDAISRGGKGGDNKKGLKIIGTVAGTSNINIGNIVGGKGGNAISNGGTGGDGNACDCDGGLGGNTQTTSGNGGDAISKKFTSIGGDAGDTTDIPGMGGEGFDCDASGPGGDGGTGGNVQTAEQGKPGTGSTTNGQPGTSLSATGGDGGNGGDGCNEGAGGAGGKGNPDGEKGDDGVNLCLAANTNTGVSLTNTTISLISFDPTAVTLDCTQGTDTVIERLNINVPAGHNWQVNQSTVPPGLEINPSQGTFETEIVQLSLKCTEPIVVNIGGQQEQWMVSIDLHDQNNNFVSGDSFFDVFYTIEIGDDNTVSIAPTSFNFTYDHNNPNCPLPIGSLNLDIPPGSNWLIVYDADGRPTWMSFPGGESGQGPGTVPVEFPCLLDEYKDQTQNTSFDVEVRDEDDRLIGSQSVDVEGNFTNF